MVVTVRMSGLIIANCVIWLWFIIGILETLGGLGLILPMVLKKFTFLIPLAALGLALVMVGAIITHIGREEPIFVNIVLVLLNLSVAYFRRDLVLNRS